MQRMQNEFKARAWRLQTETGKAPEIKLPFTESRDSLKPGDVKDWKEFREGKMSDGSTTKWIDKALKELETNLKF